MDDTGESLAVGFGGANAWTLADGAVSLVRPAIPPRP
jgi:hypothetical protein